MTVIKIKDYGAVLSGVSVDKKEAMRYCAAGNGEGFLPILEECIAEATPEISYKVCYAEFPVSVLNERVSFGSFGVKSRDLAKNLAGCESAVIFCATLGIGIDRLIKKYSDISPVRSLALQGIGAERIEALCDEFCLDVGNSVGKVRPRFSPGYGDFDISFQTKIFEVLQCGKKIGVTLNESLLITPTKSVTAIIGIEK